MKFRSALALILISVAPLAQANQSGPYLALRQAFYDSDDVRVTDYLDVELARDPNNPVLLEEAILNSVYNLDLDKAKVYADRAQPISENSVAIEAVNFATMIRAGQFHEASKLVAQSQYLKFLSPEIIEAWGIVADGKPDDAIAFLQAESDKSKELGFIFDFQIALIEAYANKNYARAVEIINGTTEPVYMSNLSYYSHIALMQLANDPKKTEFLEKQYGPEASWPGFIKRMVTSLDKGVIDPSYNFYSPQNAIVEYLYGLISSEAGQEVDEGVQRLLYGIPPSISPDSGWFVRDYMNFFSGQGHAQDVIHFFGYIKPDSFIYGPAQEDLINAYFLLEDKVKAREIADQLPTTGADEIAYRADVYRRLEDYPKAIELYEQALAIAGRDNPRYTWPIYGLAISYERMGDWAKAEPEFLAALKLEPQNADILNYLGYSYVDRGEKLNEGLQMIEKAVELSPDQGHIIDSLGWAYYRLGRYDDATQPLEEATTLMSTDAIVNTHLGDLYWQLGRKREARYQWERSVRFLEEDNQDLTRAELEDRIQNGL